MNLPNPPEVDKNARAAKSWYFLHRQLIFWIIILIIVIIVGLILHSQHQTNTHSDDNKRGQIPVVLAKAQTKNIPVYLNGLGAVTPIASVVVRTQLNGTLFKVLFHEGQMVKAGDLLAQIDPRPYEAQLQQYEGQLQRDTALLQNAKIDLIRYQTLWKQDSVSQQTLATQQALVHQYEGTVQIDLGLIAATKVSLIYCNITAPVAGRVGLRLIDPGNYVQTSDTNGIAVINLLNPITVIFTIPEDNIPDITSRLNANQPLSVRAYNRDQTKLLATGSLITIDNEIDPTTGMVRLRAQFNNDNNQLFPSQFVNARLLVKMLNNATVIPTAAIQYGTNGSFVYLLNADQTVSIKSVTASVTEGNDTVITNGVLPGQSVVVQGADNLTDGAKVKLAKPLTSIVVNTKNINHRRRLA